MNRIVNLAWPVLVVALLGAPLAAHATDGVIEINHARALAGGITPGDTAGYPVTISRSGSYRLTSNLTQANANTNVINITVDNVTLDLNGFTISGANVCSLSGTFPTQTMSCSGSGTGYGVVANGFGNMSVVNGNITGTGSTCLQLLGGIALQAQSVENVRVSHCGGNGILIDNGSVTRSAATLCLGRGVAVSSGSISAVLAQNNNIGGISGQKANVTASVAQLNLGNGFDLDQGTATGNTAYRNQGGGISIAFGTVSGNAFVWNGGNGIDVFTSAVVIGNTVSSNTLIGLAVSGGRATASQNMFDGNTSGTAGTVISAPPLSNTTNGVAW